MQKQPDKPIASHRPIDLPDPLPYLQMFTSFDFSTQLGLPRGKVLPSSKRVHQKHTIDISGPQKLLTAQLAVNIDCLSNEVNDLHILRLPSWAERELGTFMRSKAKEKNLGAVCWAIDSFWDIATKRAAYWHRCEAAFAHLLPNQTATGAENARVLNAKSSTISRKDLGRHLGRDVLILQDEHVLLKMNWRICSTGRVKLNQTSTWNALCPLHGKRLMRATRFARSQRRSIRYCGRRVLSRLQESWLPCCSRSRRTHVVVLYIVRDTQCSLCICV
jgi:hypothetical protein